MSNAAQPIWDHARRTPDRVALRGSDANTAVPHTYPTPWTYRTLRDRAGAVADRLRTAGLVPGDRVLLVASSVPEFAAAYYGMHAAGIIPVTANSMSATPELEYIGTDANVVLVLGWHDIQPAPADAAAVLGVPYWPLFPELTDIAKSTEATGGTESPFERPCATDDNDTAVILYTSGTTGSPKGAQLTYGNLHACAQVFDDNFQVITSGTRAATALPLFHVFGQVVVLGTAMRAGATLSLLARFDPAEMLALLRRDEISFVAGVPTMWNAMLLAADGLGPDDFPHLRVAGSGGASLPVEILRGFERHFACTVLEGYGLTETAGAATFNVPDAEHGPGSVGPPVPGCDVRIRSDDGTEAASGEVGEILIRGSVVMKGYWNRPDATADALRDGWLRTGDLGVKDSDGAIRIVDRKKELIIRGGYNVYPREIEEVLYQHPNIIEAAVIGVPDQHYGEEVAAVIVVRQGAAITADSLREWAKQRLSAYKVPHLVTVVDELPKGPSGKILKRAIDRDAIRVAAMRPAAATSRPA